MSRSDFKPCSFPGPFGINVVVTGFSPGSVASVLPIGRHGELLVSKDDLQRLMQDAIDKRAPSLPLVHDEVQVDIADLFKNGSAEFTERLNAQFPGAVVPGPKSPSLRGQRCGICSGSGRRAVPTSYGETTPCAACHGQGFIVKADGAEAPGAPTAVPPPKVARPLTLAERLKAKAAGAPAPVPSTVIGRATEVTIGDERKSFLEGIADKLDPDCPRSFGVDVSYDSALAMTRVSIEIPDVLALDRTFEFGKALEAAITSLRNETLRRRSLATKGKAKSAP